MVYRLSCLTLICHSCISSNINPTVEFRDEIPKIEFCQLPNYVDQMVSIQGMYSGYEEYWSIIEPEGCEPELKVEVQFIDSYMFPKEYERDFKEVHSNYYDSYLELEIIGIFENEMETYGHLGSNNALFRVIEITNLELKRPTRIHEVF